MHLYNNLLVIKIELSPNYYMLMYTVFKIRHHKTGQFILKSDVNIIRYEVTRIKARNLASST